MKKSRFSESQIVNMLKEAEAGVSVEELSRQYGFSKVTFYKWKATVRWHGCQCLEAAEGTGGRKPALEADVCRTEPGT